MEENIYLLYPAEWYAKFPEAKEIILDYIKLTEKLGNRPTIKELEEVYGRPWKRKLFTYFGGSTTSIYCKLGFFHDSEKKIFNFLKFCFIHNRIPRLNDRIEGFEYGTTLFKTSDYWRRDYVCKLKEYNLYHASMYTGEYHKEIKSFHQTKTEIQREKPTLAYLHRYKQPLPDGLGIKQPLQERING